MFTDAICLSRKAEKGIAIKTMPDIRVFEEGVLQALGTFGLLRQEMQTKAKTPLTIFLTNGVKLQGIVSRRA